MIYILIAPWQRVEFGNASTYSDCTHREIQVPTAWSSDSLSITVNQGTFEDGENSFLFVVDADGNVSNGFPITIGTDGSEVLPPTGFRVLE